MSMKGQRFCIEGVCRGLSLNLMSQMPYRRVNDQGPAQLPSASQPASQPCWATTIFPASFAFSEHVARPVGQGVSKGAQLGLSLRRTAGRSKDLRSVKEKCRCKIMARTRWH